MKKHLSLLLVVLLGLSAVTYPGYSSVASGESRTNVAAQYDGIRDFLSGLQYMQGMSFSAGDSGNSVREFEKALVKTGYLASSEVDFKYNQKTATAVKKLQKEAGITETGTADLSTQFMLVMMYGKQSSKTTCTLIQIEQYAVVLWEDAFYVGVINTSGGFVEGTYYFSTGEYYVGGFSSNKRSGKGTAYFSNGDVYIGEWKNDKMNGNGTYYFGGLNSSEYYNGAMVDNTRTGNGVYYHNGSPITGTWNRDLHTGW